MSLIHVSTKKTIKPRIASVTIPSQYPTTWFNDHPGEKPSLNLTLIVSSLEDARMIVAKAISEENLDVNAASTFLYYFAQGIKSTPEDDWTSYGRMICEKQEEMTPLNFFDVTPNNTLENRAMDRSVTAKDDPWIAGYILSVYRLLRATAPTYRAQLFDRIKAQMQGLTEAEVMYVDTGDKYRGWLSNRNYNKFVAAYDLFFHRFPDHQFATLRICTTGSRHRDCAGLTSYGYIADVLGVKNATDIMDWVFLETIANDIDRIMSDDDEMEKPHSYFPYQVDFGIVSKSSYSATINSCFFEWVHLIGAMMGSTRSQNARHITDKQSSDIFANAACVAYVHNFNFEFTKADTEDGESAEFEEPDAEQQESEHDLIIKSKDPTDWITLIKVLKGNLPDKVRAFIKHTGQSIKEPRPGSMSEHLKKKAAVL